MIINQNSVFELRYYLNSFKSLVSTVSLDNTLYKDGTSIGQIMFHVGESVNHHLRVLIMQQKYNRVRSEEFEKTHSQKEVLLSFEKALLACDELVAKEIHLEQKINKIKHVNSIGFDLTTAYEVFLHVTAHTAEHFGQISSFIENKK